MSTKTSYVVVMIWGVISVYQQSSHIHRGDRRDICGGEAGPVTMTFFNNGKPFARHAFEKKQWHFRKQRACVDSPQIYSICCIYCLPARAGV